MVPSALLFLDTLPLTSTGKVDRQALPGNTGIRPELEKAFVAPRSPSEKALAGIWAELLGLERVGTHDNFLELGEHSLLATQLIARLSSALQVELPLCRLFEAPTVSDFTHAIEQHHGHAASALERLAW
jgi:acyl carrier protein